MENKKRPIGLFNIKMLKEQGLSEEQIAQRIHSRILNIVKKTDKAEETKPKQDNNTPQ